MVPKLMCRSPVNRLIGGFTHEPRGPYVTPLTSGRFFALCERNRHSFPRCSQRARHPQPPNGAQRQRTGAAGRPAKALRRPASAARRERPIAPEAGGHGLVQGGLVGGEKICPAPTSMFSEGIRCRIPTVGASLGEGTAYCVYQRWEWRMTQRLLADALCPFLIRHRKPRDKVRPTPDTIGLLVSYAEGNGRTCAASQSTGAPTPSPCRSRRASRRCSRRIAWRTRLASRAIRRIDLAPVGHPAAAIHSLCTAAADDLVGRMLALKNPDFCRRIALG